MFQLGEKVSFLYEKGDGIVKEIKATKFLIEDNTGFDRWFEKNELVKIHGQNYDSTVSFNASLEEKADLTYTVLEQKSSQAKGFVVWEVDLHIDEIIDSTRNLTNHEMLQKQLKELKATFKKAKINNINRLIVIHGVGEGVLKNEVRSYLNTQEGVDVYDADFRDYGKGATAVDFHPNWK